jgi:chromosome segregation ATPase
MTISAEDYAGGLEQELTRAVSELARAKGAVLALQRMNTELVETIRAKDEQLAEVAGRIGDLDPELNGSTDEQARIDGAVAELQAAARETDGE